MLRLVYIIALFNIICAVDSQCCGNDFSMQYLNNVYYNPYLDDTNDSDEEESRDNDTQDVFNDLATSLMDAENDLRQYCDKNERAIELYNTEQYQCLYTFNDYEDSSVYIRIRHRVMRVIAISKPGVWKKILDDVKIIPDFLQTGDAAYELKEGSLTITIPFDRMKSDTCPGPWRDTFVVPYNIRSLFR